MISELKTKFDFIINLNTLSTNNPLSHLRALSAARLSAQDHHVVLSDGLHDLLLHAAHGELRGGEEN
jgi:hypothetical protein